MVNLNKWGFRLLGIFLTVSLVFTGCAKVEKQVSKEQNTIKSDAWKKGTSMLYYLGHASVKIKTSNGTVIYIDPAFGDDYSEPADIVLITHLHSDHYQLSRISTDKKYKLIMPEQALIAGVYQKLDIQGIKVESVPAYNENHLKADTVGYILEFDGIKLYHAGDTSKIKEMADLATKNITYALLPMEGVYNMGPEEATECAKIINAKNYIPIHTSPDGTFNQAIVDKFNVTNKIVLKPGAKLELKG